MERRAEAKPVVQSWGRRLAVFAAPVVLAGVVVVGAMASRGGEAGAKAPDAEAQASFKPYVPTGGEQVAPTPEVKPVEQPAAVVKPAAPEAPVAPAIKPLPAKGPDRFERQAARLNAMRPYLHKDGERPPSGRAEVSAEDMALRKRALRGNPLYKSPIFNRRANIKQRELLRRFNDPNYTIGSAKPITVDDLYAKNPQAIQQLRDEKRARVVQIKRGGVASGQ